MKRKIIIVFLILGYITMSSFAHQKKVELTYVGNAGFLIKIGDKKILIDAVFKGFEGSYNLPQEIQEKLISAQAPFNDVDLILVTHAHGDHIDPAMLSQHLENNPNAIFASTQQLVDALKDVSERSIGFNPTKGKSDKKDIKGISIESFYLPHGPDSRIINIGFLISVNGTTIFQTGDIDFDQFTFEEFRSLQLPEKKIDLSFIQHFYLTNDSVSKKFVNEAIGGRYIIPIHYHFTTPSFDAAIVKENYPDAIIFEEELQSWQMPEREQESAKLKDELFEAIDAGDLAKVKALIESAPGLLEIKDRSGSTPLIRACLNFQTFGRQVEVAKFLIEAGADVNVINNYQATALLMASVGRGPDYDLIKLLVSKGADVNVQGYNGITALHWAVKYNDLKTAKFLLESGANINISNDYNGPISNSTISGTVLQVAINYSLSNEMVKFIIENGAKQNIKDSQGNTELHLVALKGNTEQAKILIEQGIDLNAKNNFDRTALYYAAKHGYRRVAELLIATGADKSTMLETNYGKAKQLSESLEEGEAYIWDLNFSYAVKTKNNLLVFTLGGIIGESSESGLSNGFLNADELIDQKITVFLRHRGSWPMDGKRFTELAKLTSNVKMVSSIKPDFSKMEESEIPAYRFASPNENFSVDGIKVHTIPALASGMGYLVEVDGLKIFHAGLHISDDDPEHIEKFRKEIDFLKAFGPVDVVMLSTHSHSNDVGTGYEQYLYLLDKLAPKAIYLWGANVPEQYVQCAEFLKVRNIPIKYPETSKAAGERFHYQGDKGHK